MHANEARQALTLVLKNWSRLTRSTSGFVTPTRWFSGSSARCKSAGCCLCSIDEDYRDKTLMPCDTFSCLNLLPLHDPRQRPQHRTLHSSSKLSNRRWPTQLSATMRTVLTLLVLFSLTYHSEFFTAVMFHFPAYTLYFLNISDVGAESSL